MTRASARVVKAQSRLSQDDYGSDQGKGAQEAEAGKPKEWRQQSVGGGRSWTQAGLRWVVRAQLRQDWNSGHGWEGENVKWHVGHPHPRFI